MKTRLLIAGRLVSTDKDCIHHHHSAARELGAGFRFGHRLACKAGSTVESPKTRAFKRRAVGGRQDLPGLRGRTMEMPKRIGPA